MAIACWPLILAVRRPAPQLGARGGQPVRHDHLSARFCTEDYHILGISVQLLHNDVEDRVSGSSLSEWDEDRLEPIFTAELTSPQGLTRRREAVELHHV